MPAQTRSLPATPATTDAGRENLRAIRDRIRERAARRSAAQVRRLDSARAAIRAGATVRDVVDAAGLSRAYLHRLGIHAPQTPRSPAAGAALDRARAARDELAQLDVDDSQEKAARRAIALELLDDGLPERELAQDAGVTQEWVRRRFTDG
jgi:AraC-like DNA-binding protein